MTPPKPRTSSRTDEQRLADLDRTVAAYATSRRPAQGPMAARSAVMRAQHLAGLVRDEGPDGIGAYLDALEPDQLYALVVALAAMVPLDTPVADLLAWVDQPEEDAAA